MGYFNKLSAKATELYLDNAPLSMIQEKTEIPAYDLCALFDIKLTKVEKENSNGHNDII